MHIDNITDILEDKEEQNNYEEYDHNNQQIQQHEQQPKQHPHQQHSQQQQHHQPQQPQHQQKQQHHHQQHSQQQHHQPQQPQQQQPPQQQQQTEEIIDFSMHKTNIPSDNLSFTITCPIRQLVREEAKTNLEKSRKAMTEKFERHKKNKMFIFNVENHVTCGMPKKFLHKSSIKRIPCVIIEKSHGVQPTYKLMSEFGVLNGRYDASKLMPYPGKVIWCNPDKKVTLQAAASKFLAGDAIFCRCKGKCQTKSCLCSRMNIGCGSRCHQGRNQNCLNKGVRNDSMILPRYGGRYGIDNTIYRFINTCPLDTWFCILKYFGNDIMSKLEFYVDKFKTLMNLIRINDYSGGRINVAAVNEIKPNGDTIDFYGSEFTLFIKPYLLEYFKSYVNTRCDNPFCSNPDRMLLIEDCPAVSSTDVLTEEMFQKEITSWFNSEENSGICGNQVTSGTPKENCFSDKNMETG